MTDEASKLPPKISRRGLFKAGAVVGAAGALPVSTTADAQTPPPQAFRLELSVNGTAQPVEVDARTTLLDALRERIGLTGTKVGCNHGQCGACTVVVDGERVLSCLSLAVSVEGREIRTVEGIAQGGALDPIQTAFIKHDGFQCGYCTPGQICSAYALVDEIRKGYPSATTQDVRQPLDLDALLSDEEIRERMSGNLCRCAAYNGIVEAVREGVSGKLGASQTGASQTGASQTGASQSGGAQ